MLEKRSLSYTDGPLSVPAEDVFLVDNVHSIRICEAGILLRVLIVHVGVSSETEIQISSCTEKRKRFMQLKS